MHELSIANSIIEIVLEQIQELSDCQVNQINLRIGKLSCVHEDSLNFSFELIAADTPLRGAKLNVTRVPVMVYCQACQQLQELPSIQKFRCPVCDLPTSDVRQGQELEIESLEMLETKND